MPTNNLYSIGYATKPMNIFLQQLMQYEVDVIVDVRSVPYSKAFHDYHREPLIETLKLNRIRYLYLGEELGPRSKVDEHYDECNQVQFERLMQSDFFLEGMRRVRDGLNKGFSIALMCAEKDPADCHRSLLIAHYMRREYDIDIQHIRHTGEVELQHQLEKRLLELHGLSDDLFSSEEELLERAYHMQCKEQAYIRPAEQ